TTASPSAISPRNGSAAAIRRACSARLSTASAPATTASCPLPLARLSQAPAARRGDPADHDHLPGVVTREAADDVAARVGPEPPWQLPLDEAEVGGQL